MDKECVNSADRAAVLAAAFKRLRAKVGNNLLLGRIVGRSRQGARKWEWTGVPPDHIFELEDETGIPAYDIHPFFYPRDRILRWAKQIEAEKRRSKHTLDDHHNTRTPA